MSGALLRLTRPGDPRPLGAPFAQRNDDDDPPPAAHFGFCDTLGGHVGLTAPAVVAVAMGMLAL